MNRIAEVIFTPKARCAGCGRMTGNEGDWLCEACRAMLVPASDEHACPVCMTPAGGGDVCPVCAGQWDKRLTARFAYPYRPPADGIVKTGKYESVYRLFDFCAEQILELCVTDDLAKPDCLVPVPMHPLRQKRRGFNQAEKLAGYLSEKTGYSVEKALRRTRLDRSQAKLSGRERRSNLIGAFACVAPVDGKKIWLIDDVRTTGATALACSDALFAAGAESVLLLTFAGVADYGVTPK